MLLERAGEVTAKIATYEKLKSAADEAGMFATRAGQFKEAAQRIANVRGKLDALSAAAIEVDFAPTDGLGLAEKARQLSALTKENPAKLKEPPFDLKYGFTDRLNEIAKAAERAAQSAWESYVANRAAFGSDDVLGALAAVPQFRDSVSRIRQIRASVASFGSALPADPSTALARIDEIVAEHEQVWATLNAADIPSSVVAFIRAAANRGAALDSLTPEVRTWLESRHLLDAFRIKLQ